MLNLIIHRPTIAIQVDGGRERLQGEALGFGRHLVYVEHQASVDEVVPRGHPRELGGEAGTHVVRGRLRQAPARAPPVESEPFEPPAHAGLIGVRRVSGEQGFDQRCPGGVGELRRKRARERSEEHTSELQSLAYLVCRLLLEKKKRSW